MLRGSLEFQKFRGSIGFEDPKHVAVRLLGKKGRRDFHKCIRFGQRAYPQPVRIASS
jgi:hypothetical protein